MIQKIREFVLRDAMADHFEMSFGPGGAWSKMYSAASGFQGVSLLEDTENPRRYLVVEVWESIESRAMAVANKQSEFDELQDNLASWSESISKIGIFRIQAEGNVRPTVMTKRRRRRS